MKIVYENHIKQIKNIVESKAKYQKVMLIYDNSTTSSLIAKIRDNIKSLCVYNEINIFSENIGEVQNGYRLLIFCCDANSFLNFGYDLDEFENIFMPTNSSFLPFYISNNNHKQNQDGYLLLNRGLVDISCFSTVWFNKFYNYLNDIYLKQSSNIEFDFSQTEFTQLSCLKILKDIAEDFVFVDIDIIKKMNIGINLLPLVDLLLINAFIVLIKSVRERNFMVVDVYKAAKENYDLIDKFYAMTYNQTFLSLLNLNYNCLINLSEKTKEKILETVNISEFSNEVFYELIEKIKMYAIGCDGIIGYLYLFDLFDA